MRRLISVLVLLLGSVVAALWFERQGGFVMLRVGDWTVQSSLFVALAAIVLLWLAITTIWTGLLRIGRTPGKVRAHWEDRREQRAEDELIDGLIELAEGRYTKAEKHLASKSAHANQPMLHYLLAALAAQRQAAWQRRDRLLAQADAAEPRARVAVGLLQAQLQVDAQQWEQALATLSWLRGKAPQNHRVVGLLTRTYQALNDAQGLADLLPELRRAQALPDDEIAVIERNAFQRRIEQLGRTASSDALAQVWRELPRERRRDPSLRAIYARGLMAADCPATAERQLRRWLKQRWEPLLVEVFGELVSDPPQRAYDQTRQWLEERPEDPVLLYVAARQAMRCELWGQARSYLEASVARAEHTGAERLLAQVYERLDEPDRARRCYRRALGLSTD